MDDAPDDPVVTMDDLKTVRQQLFRRWQRPLASLLGKLLLFALPAAFLFYLTLKWAYPTRSNHVISMQVAIVIPAVFAVPFAIYAFHLLRLDFRIAKRLDDMAARLRLGEVVKASDLKL